MRTTLTIDDELLEELRLRAATRKQSFKGVVNEVIRNGLQTLAVPEAADDEFVVEARSHGFRPGVDLMRLNQMLDETDIEEFMIDNSGAQKIADS